MTLNFGKVTIKEDKDGYFSVYAENSDTPIAHFLKLRYAENFLAFIEAAERAQATKLNINADVIYSDLDLVCDLEALHLMQKAKMIASW